MTRSLRFLSPLAAAALLSGCAGLGPNTQQGAVAGGALGAAAGAIIGNNTRGHNALAGALIGGTAGALAGGTIGNSLDHERGTLYGAGTTTVVVAPAVPPPPAPLQPAASLPSAPNYVWVPGYWDYVGAEYVWVCARWMVPPPGKAAFVPPHWAYNGNACVFVGGVWK